ncbi:hypothetical protein L3Q82_004603 [Scortum barcoo]|uniref:Uncharacterized protein n=1 Tax=Scortum barcoo TaxID=214431 RepID=A0ACB8VGI1_9TELE|nr:hypothetical protein L3Q82_004603 [Scortum barcoo]
MSDHISVNLIPAYKPLICRTRPTTRTVQVWTEEAFSALQDCFECTDWEVFKEGTDLDGYTPSVLFYLKFCTDAVLPTKTIKVFPNQKPWLDSTVKPLLKACDAAYRSGDKLAYSIARKELKKGIKLAKSSSAFNTVIPDKLILKLHNLGLPSLLCHWIRDFLTNRPQVVRIGDNTSSTLVLSTGTPQGCVLSPALFTLFTSDCSAIHSTNTIVKFADDTTIVGLISDNDETHYREEIQHLTQWCSNNNLVLNTSKTKGGHRVDYRRSRRTEQHAPLLIHGEAVERCQQYQVPGHPHHIS